jgi:hypothetical protein
MLLLRLEEINQQLKFIVENLVGVIRHVCRASSLVGDTFSSAEGLKPIVPPPPNLKAKLSPF